MDGLSTNLQLQLVTNWWIMHDMVTAELTFIFKVFVYFLYISLYISAVY